MSAEAIISVHLQQHTPAPLKTILKCHTQFLSLTDPLSTRKGECASYTHTKHTNKGGTGLIAFCPPLKGWPPGSCSPSRRFIMAAVHPSSCCLTLKKFVCACVSVPLPPQLGFLFSYSSKPFTLCWLVKPQKALVLFPSTNPPASCLYFCPQGHIFK